MVAYPNNPNPHDAAVLITDDNDAWRDAVNDVLSRAGFQTVQAACGEEAIQVVHLEHIDVALIDFHMPRIDGLETIRRIRAEHLSLPAALMTAHPQDVPVAEVHSLHVECVIAKQAGRRQIVSVVTHLLRTAWHRASGSPDEEFPSEQAHE
jgi:CheY-like chemotaxis protein